MPAGPSLRPNNLAGVVNAEQERPALGVGQTGDGLGQITIVEMRLELACQCLAGTDQVARVHVS